MPNSQKKMAQKDFLDKIRKELPELSDLSDKAVMDQILAKRPDVRDMVDIPPPASSRIQGSSDIRPAGYQHSIVDPEFWKSHPTGAEFLRQTMGSLPAIGSIVGGALSTPETMGAGTIPGLALGAGAGRGLQDIATEMLGLKPESSPMGKTANIGMDALIAAITPGATEAVMHPMSTAREAVSDYLRMTPSKLRGWIHPQFLEDFAKGGGKAADPMIRPPWQSGIRTVQGEVVGEPASAVKEGEIIRKALPASKTGFYAGPSSLEDMPKAEIVKPKYRVNPNNTFTNMDTGEVVDHAGNPVKTNLPPDLALPEEYKFADPFKTGATGKSGEETAYEIGKSKFMAGPGPSVKPQFNPKGQTGMTGSGATFDPKTLKFVNDVINSISESQK